MALLDVNALVALAWNRHVHHAAIHAWFDESPDRLWATCPLTEAGFVRVSSNPGALGDAVALETARSVFHRQATHAVLLTLARRHGVGLVTFDAGLADVARGDGVQLLRA